MVERTIVYKDNKDTLASYLFSFPNLHDVVLSVLSVATLRVASTFFLKTTTPLLSQPNALAIRTTFPHPLGCHRCFYHSQCGTTSSNQLYCCGWSIVSAVYRLLKRSPSRNICCLPNRRLSAEAAIVAGPPTTTVTRLAVHTPITENPAVSTLPAVSGISTTVFSVPSTGQQPVKSSRTAY